jgi:large subunit ribosomal protein L18
MENNILKRNAKRKSRVLRVRKHVRGSAEKPRLCVFRTNKHISVQLIDDESHTTLASAGSLAKEHRKTKLGKKSKETAKHIGQKIAELAKGKKIDRVVFDRGRLKYHGVIAELANAAREAGLQF